MYILQEQNKRRLMLVLVTVIIFSIQIFAQERDNISYNFSRTDTSFSFYGRFQVVAEATCMIDICFTYEHIRALALDARRVELIEEGEDWNIIKYTYQIFPLYENESVWYRTIDREETEVYFMLRSSKNNHTYMPRIRASSGYYKISRIEGTLVVEYFQQGLITKNYLSALYQYSMKKKAVEFLYMFKDYAQTHCQRR